MSTKTIKLTKPISHDSKTWNEVTVRPATLGDMLAADLVQGEQTKQAAIYASVCEVPFPAFRQLAAPDYIKIATEADGLAGNPTSEPPPEATGAGSAG